MQPEVAHTICSQERRRKNSVSKNETEETCNLKKHSHSFKGQELSTYPAETRQDDKRDKKDLSEMALT